MVTSLADDDVRFFFDNQGWSSPPGRLACAERAARAEYVLDTLEDRGIVRVVWVEDLNHKYVCVLDVLDWAGGWRTLAVMSGLATPPGDPYRRVVRVELAVGAMVQLERLHTEG